jgi:ArsR family transcriptional regulator
MKLSCYPYRLRHAGGRTPSTIQLTASDMGDSRAVAVLAALGHGMRLSLWRLLLIPYGSSGLSAGAIAARMDILPSSLSFHLRQMTQAGLLVQRRSSRKIIYAADRETMDDLVAFLATPFALLPPGLSDQPNNIVSER